MTHRELCVLAARWVRFHGCQLTGYEVAAHGGILDVLGTTDPRAVPVNQEHLRTAKAEAEARWLGTRLPDPVPGQTWEEQAHRQRQAHHAALLSNPRTVPEVYHRNVGHRSRVVVVEVKRTRADLLADLREGKMLGYGANATHAYLAATPEALGALEDLEARRLPTSWGVLELRPELWRGLYQGSVVRQRVLDAVIVRRKPQALREATPALVWEAAHRISLAMCNRVLFHDDPATPAPEVQDGNDQPSPAAPAAAPGGGR